MKGIFQRWKTEPMKDILLAWLRRWWHFPAKPDPWPEEVGRAIWEPDAVEVCHHCFAPQSEPRWFCPECGAAVGQYNNWMHYIHIFSVGEVLRSGMGPEARFSRLTVPGYVVFGLLEFGIFAPVYYVQLFRNWRRHARKPAQPPEPDPGS